jgi:hypothetical protein
MGGLSRVRRVPGGEGQNRTVDTTIFSRVLYLLSYLAGSRQDSKTPLHMK